ncbi:MAG: thioredoxin family protein [Prevotella sp.]|nr:thioredoxin family protein [Prevotella sp.]
MRKFLISWAAALFVLAASAQTGLKKVYQEDINPLEQIDQAVVKAKAEGKFVICQVGGNWCPWCLRFADFIANDSTISGVIEDNFEYIHVNYNPRSSTSDRSSAENLKPSGDGEQQAALSPKAQAAALMNRLDNCGRFGFPVFVVLDEEGHVIHIQDSSFLEEGQGYNQEKVLRFFKNWTPKAVKG